MERCSGQLRIAGLGAGVIGLDMAAVWQTSAALGLDPRFVAELVPYAEAGMVAAHNSKRGETET